jgi:hypothetical protein
MLCLTSHFEQEWNVQALERKGYGVSANEFNATDWKKNIEIYCSTVKTNDIPIW